MTSEERTRPLQRGVWGVVATPFRGPELAVDPGSLGRLVAHYETVGATGLTVLGVFGEASSLTVRERALVLSTAAEHCRLPIVAGVSSLATAPAIAEIDEALGAVDGRIVAAMVQVNSPRAEIVIAHLHEIHAATGAPVVLQDYPVASGVVISTEALLRVIDACPFICAVKAEAPPTAAAIALIAERTSASVFGGLGGQSLLDELASGSAGAMTGFSIPEALVACVTAWLAGDHDEARRAFTPYLPLVNFEQQPKIALALRKDLFTRRHLFDEGAVRPPAAPFPGQLERLAVEHLARAEALLVGGRR
ncbi:dihydrodipicolinate synthase family protein [Microbacterium murale]|uniref:4-hydroxy-tetrahydrodipicolinate synthase n=1 Tax=Microbacterium murale TaxID=1081040 RepID=A0ABU0P6X1_9MICO|nr:dihydrodipicolinate synthase family protein [Microbacterium murale]MDQ0643085.1 4-hydroxy-tetrahydrodipicolinate synthase [Microbacterium murale]